MTKRGILLVLDTSMLLSFSVLMSWRFSGLIAHEWIGLGLIALILLHLVVHWSWVEAKVKTAVAVGRKSRPVPLILNIALFAAMGTALVSGVVISKVVIPNHLTPAGYLQWHGLHETASNLSLILLGLHVALNWDRILSSIRRAFGARHGWNMKPAEAVRRLVWVVAVSAILAGGVWAETRVFPSHAQIMRVYPNGHREIIPPPAEITRLGKDTVAPNLRFGVRYFWDLVWLVVIAVIGRRVLGLRLTRQTRTDSTLLVEEG